MVLFYGMFSTTRTKMGMIRQSYNRRDGINFSADAKRFTHKTKKKNNIMSILRRCKKITSCYFSWCKFSYCPVHFCVELYKNLKKRNEMIILTSKPLQLPQLRLKSNIKAILRKVKRWSFKTWERKGARQNFYSLRFPELRLKEKCISNFLWSEAL